MKRLFSIVLVAAVAAGCWYVYGLHLSSSSPDSASTASDTAYAATNWRYNIQIMARCVHGEARGEPYEGQVAVAAVILNRVKHPSFPKTIAGVIYQPGAFTAVTDGQINVPVSTKSPIYQACLDAANGWDPVSGAIYYYNPAKTTNKWIWSRPVIKRIGNHVFCK